MTKMQATDDNKSGQSGQSGNSGNSGGSNGSGKKSRKERIAEAADRKAIAKLNRRLAESAGRVLHELILLGSGEVKQKIISAIIATVQQPGSTPPEDVPALMTILRSAAEEQLMFTQKLDSLSALLSAIEFGRWIKVPTIKLGEARKNFMNAQEARKRQIRSAAAGGPSAGGPSASGPSAAGNSPSANASAPADAPAAQSAETQRSGQSSHRSRRKKKKDPNASASAVKRANSFTRRLKSQKKLKAKIAELAEADNKRSQQRLTAFKAALSKQSSAFRKQQRRLMGPAAPSLESMTSSVVHSIPSACSMRNPPVACAQSLLRASRRRRTLMI